MKSLRQASLLIIYILALLVQGGVFIVFIGRVTIPMLEINLDSTETGVATVLFGLSLLFLTGLYFAARKYFTAPVRQMRQEIAYFLA